MSPVSSKKQNSTKIIPKGRQIDGNMDAVDKELEPNPGCSHPGCRHPGSRAVCTGYMRGLPKPGPMSEAA